MNLEPAPSCTRGSRRDVMIQSPISVNADKTCASFRGLLHKASCRPFAGFEVGAARALIHYVLRAQLAVLRKPIR